MTDCRKRQPRQQTGEFPAGQTSSPTTSDAFSPGLLYYADIQQNPRQVSTVDNLYANVASDDFYENSGAVAIIYSELQRNE